MTQEEGTNRKRNNYKLLVDPELQKGKKKLYRLNGSIPGKPPIADPEDPRVQKTVLGVIGKDLELPVPRFKCDRFWVGDLPNRDVLITGVTEQLQPLVKDLVEGIGPIHSIKFHKSLKLKTAHASVLFQRAGDGQKAVEQLNNKMVNGSKISVVLDDKGDNLKILLDPIFNKDSRRPSTDKSSASTPTSKNPCFDFNSKDSAPSNMAPLTASASVPSASVSTPQVCHFPGLMLSGNSSPSVSNESGGCFSPGFTPQTPSSLDSGICVKQPTFDPLLSLRSSLGKLTNSKSSNSHSNTLPPLPPEEGKKPLPPPPPIKEDEGIENISSDEGGMLSPPLKTGLNSDRKESQTPPVDPRLKKSMWKPVTEIVEPPHQHKPNKFEMEYEEISGDESPVMVYNTQLEVEEISSDEGEADGMATQSQQQGSDDMEISDEDASQNENLIELNVRPTSKSFTPYHNTPLTPAMILPPPMPPPPIPMYPPPIPPPGFPPPYPPPEMFPPLPPQPPMLPSNVNGYQEPSYKSAPPTERNHFTPTKQWKVPPANNRKERRGRDVLYRVLEQLASILLKDYEKKVVESAAYPVLDRFWEKREKERREKEAHHTEDDKKKTNEESNTLVNGIEANEQEQSTEPYRRMLPGLIPAKDDFEDTPTTPRKRLMNFKIPFIRQRRDAVMVARRRLHDDRDRKKKRRLLDDVSRSRSKRSRSPRYDLSDISSDELSSEEEEEEEELTQDDEQPLDDEIEDKVSPFGPRTPPPPSSDSSSSLEESDIFGSTMTSSEDDSGSVSSDFEEELKRKVTKRKPNRRLSSNTIDATLADDSQEMLTNSLPSPPLAMAHKKDQVEEEEIEKEIKKEPKYRKRTAAADRELLERFFNSGLDKEDLLMIRLAFLRLRTNNSDIINGVPWAYYPPVPSSEPPSKKRKTLEEELHPTGCARSEGYYKIDPKDKTKYLPHLRRGKGETAETTKEKSSGSGRGNRLNHRRVASLYTSGDVSRELHQYNQLKARNKQLRFAKSTIHNWGLFALEDIPADEMVVEYVGQYVRQMVADERERRYEAQGIGSSYLFRVDYEYIIDATKSGNFARFINHCCDPNCYAKVISIGNQKKIVIYSKRDIKCGEEITYDYKFPIEDEKIPCLCGAPQCRGTLN